MVIYDFTGISSLDGFKKYKTEQRVIWDNVVPKYAQNLICEIEQKELENNNYNHLINYRIIKTAISINNLFQKFRNRILY